MAPQPTPPPPPRPAAAQQLEKLGRELKCPICLSLFKQAASLSCNHSFCSSCILLSIKRTPDCPICKVPTTRREVRAAPQMDSLVTIYRGMESVADVSHFASQIVTGDTAEELKQIESDEGCVANTKGGSSSAVPSKRQRCKYKQSDNSMLEDQNTSRVQPVKGVIPAKKRVHVPLFPSISGDLGINQQNAGTFLSRRKGSFKAKKVKVGKEKEYQERGSAAASETKSLEHLEISWSREGIPQDIECSQVKVQAMQLTQSQPAFSDLRDSNGNNADESDKDVAKDGYNSDEIALTQPAPLHPRCTPTKKQERVYAHHANLRKSSNGLRSSKASRDPECCMFMVGKNDLMIQGTSIISSSQCEDRSDELKLKPRKAICKKNTNMVSCSAVLNGSDIGSRSKETSPATDRISKHSSVKCSAPVHTEIPHLFDSMEGKSLESSKAVCAFCRAPGDSELAGPLIHYKGGVPLQNEVSSGDSDIHVHRLCAEWAPDVYFVGDVAKNLTSEIARGRKIKCSNCKLRGAALGCCLKQCRKSYHYPCARAISCRWDDVKFIILCPEHATCNFPHDRGRKPHATNTSLRSDAIQIDLQGRSIVDAASNVNVHSEKWPVCSASKWVLCGSGLSSAQKEELASFASLTGTMRTKAWSSNVTHIIAGTDDHGAARRTLKFLMAILEGKWILRTDWMAACIATGKPVGEEPYEIHLDIHGMADGPKRGRSLAAAKAPKLFGGIDFYLIGDYVPAYKVNLQALVIAAGGVLLHRRPVNVEGLIEHNRTIVVYFKDFPLSRENGNELARMQAEANELASLVGASVAPHLWILDSIAASELQPLECYSDIIFSGFAHPDD